MSEARHAFRTRQKQDRAKQQRKDLNPALELQPKERGARYDNLRSARAEEGIIRLLVLDSALFFPTAPIAPQTFSSPLLAKTYAALLRCAQEGRSNGIAVLSECLTGEEMSHITNILQQPESAAWREQALQGLHIHCSKRGGQAQPRCGRRSLTAAIEKNKEKKQYGGKRNG